MAFELKSSAFKNGESIPARYTGTGENISPPLEWSGSPEGTRSFALISDDPDAPMGTWVHWIVYDIPPDKNNLPEGVSKEKVLHDGSKQGRTSFLKIGYGGPYPPRGPAHRYFFKLYALDTKLDLKPGATKKILLKAMEGHIIEKVELMGRFQR